MTSAFSCKSTPRALFLMLRPLLCLFLLATFPLCLRGRGVLVGTGSVGGMGLQQESGQQRVDLCATKATLAGDSMITCELQRDASSQNSLQQTLDVYAALLLDIARRAVLPQAVPAAQQGLDLAQAKELVKSTFNNDVQPGVARDTAAKIDAAKEGVMKEVRELAASFKVCQTKTEELKSAVRSQREAMEALSAAVGSSGSSSSSSNTNSGATGDVRERVGALEAVWRESRQAHESQNAARGDKLDSHSVSIATLQSTLSQAEAARFAAEETVSALRERVSKLEVLVDLLIKKL